jgi:hypothetical protein
MSKRVQRLAAAGFGLLALAMVPAFAQDQSAAAYPIILSAG